MEPSDNITGLFFPAKLNHSIKIIVEYLRYSNMKQPKHLIALCLSIFSFSAFSQFEGLVSLTNNDKMINFDCVTHQDSVLLDLNLTQGDFGMFNFEITSDPFNMRYLINGYSDSAGQGYHLFTYDVNLNQMTNTDQFEFRKIKYDPFQNSLVYNTGFELMNYDLSTHQHTLIKPLSITANLSGLVDAYDFVHQQYLYINNDSAGYHLVFVDMTTGDVISDTPLDFNELAHEIVFDYTTSTYYGMSNSGNFGDFVSIDPLTGQQLVIVNIPDWNSFLNESTASFDYSRHQYMIPYYSNLEESKIAIIDVNTHTLLADTLYPMSDANQYFGNAKPPIQQNGSQLKAVYATGYQWYKDGVSQFGETNQLYEVEAPGDYFVKVFYENDRGAYSDTISISDLGLVKQNKVQELTAKPNPFDEYTIIDLSGLKGNSWVLKLFSATGEVVYQSSEKESTMIKLERQQLENGLYLFTVETEFGIQGIGKLLIH
jgi:hypothetical protein